MLSKILQFFTRSEILLKQKQKELSNYKQSIIDLTAQLSEFESQTQILNNDVISTQGKIQVYKGTHQMNELDTQRQQQVISDIEFLFLERDEIKQQIKDQTQIALQKEAEIKRKQHDSKLIEENNKEFIVECEKLREFHHHLEKQVEELEKEFD
ncbi:hypothetical protein SS50377_25292 [Spironucleus salmonicida]|uniref:Uncharacterized protein n=1 Tax=Spironucleus salmonicida TaxID=348837 RepID=V6LBM6_9EUKA|nr:hypothetical protein SS50377_25292 [Spironucleus salmonicida]|eukprot:EST41827.1 Hypothetical protein SS50377_18661 [Spironucleus salmonicida]